MARDFRASQIQTTQIISSGSSGTNARIVFYPVEKQSGVSPNQGIIDPTKFGTGSIGVDTFVYVSGGIGERNTTNNSIAVFGGDVHISGNLTSDQQIFGEGGSLFRLSVVDFASTQQTVGNPLVAGQVVFPGNEFSGSSLTLRAVLANTTGSGIAAVKLFNVDTMTFVDIQGPSQQELAVTGTTPTLVESVNLLSASGFVTGAVGIYELQLFSNLGTNTAQVGGGELRPSGSFTGNTIITQSSVTNVISGNLAFRLGIVDFARTTNTSSNPLVAGQVIFPADEFSGSLNFRTVLNSTNASTTASVRLFNATSGAYVELASGQDALETTNLAPTVVESQNLFGAINFDTSSQAVYEVHLHTSNGSNEVLVGGAEFRPSGSFTGQTIVSESVTFFSGTWVDSNNRLRTTASVAIDGGGNFADAYGSDVFLYVSGTINTWTTSSIGQKSVSVFGGDVRISGSVIGGEGSRIDDPFSATTGSLTPFNFIGGGVDHVITPFSNGQEGFGNGLTARNFIGAGTANTITQSSDSAIVGGKGNQIFEGVLSGGFIGAGNRNTVIGNDAAQVAGFDNTTSGDRAFGGAGDSNFASGEDSVVVGGANNGVAVGAAKSAIVAGRSNNITNNEENSFIGAGQFNTVDGDSSAIVAGYNNEIDNDGFQSFIGAGQNNQIDSFGISRWQGILVGSGNRIQGFSSEATNYSVILGGQSNLINQSASLLFGFDLTGSFGGGNTIQFGSRIAGKRPFRFVVSASRGAVFHGGLSGSLTRIEDGSPYLLAGDNITLVTNSNGQIAISSSGGGGSTSLQGAYNNGPAIEPAGDAVTISGSGVGSGIALLELVPEDAEYYGLQVRSTGSSGEALILLHGNNSAAGGGGIKLLSSQGQLGELAWQNSTLGSANTDLASVRFDDARRSLIIESVESPLGTILTSSVELRANRVLVTGSAVVSGIFGAKGGFVADSSTNVSLTPTLTNYGQDVYFYVSGTFGSGSAGDAVAVFGGDVRISGTLAVGTGSLFLDDNNIFFTSASIRHEGGQLIFYDDNNLTGRTLQQLASGSGGSGDSFFFSNVANNIQTTGSLEASGSGLFKSGLTGALNVLPDGAPFLVAGANVTLATGSNGQITIGAVTGSAGAGGANNEIQFNLAGALTGSSNFWVQDGVSVNVSGAVVASSGFSGSLTTLSDGSPYLLAGDNITLVTNSVGQIEISSSGGGGGDSFFYSSTAGLVEQSGSLRVTGSVTALGGLSGSLTTLTDGSPYLIAGNNIVLSTGSNGAVTLAVTGVVENGFAVEFASGVWEVDATNEVYTISGSTHGLDTSNLQIQLYQSQSDGFALVTAQETLINSSFDVRFTISSGSSFPGRAVLLRSGNSFGNDWNNVGGTLTTSASIEVGGNVSVGGQAFPTQTGSLALTGSSLTTDLNNSNVHFHTLTTGGLSLSTASNQQPGGSYIWIIRQDGTGGHGLTFDSNFFTVIGNNSTIVTGANKTSILSGISDGSSIYLAIAGDES